MVSQELIQFKKDLIHLIKTDEDVKNLIFNIVVNNENFDQRVEDANESNEYDKGWTEAHAWT